MCYRIMYTFLVRWANRPQAAAVHQIACGDCARLSSQNLFVVSVENTFHISHKVLLDQLSKDYTVSGFERDCGGEKSVFPADIQSKNFVFK